MLLLVVVGLLALSHAAVRVYVVSAVVVSHIPRVGVVELWVGVSYHSHRVVVTSHHTLCRITRYDVG